MNEDNAHQKGAAHCANTVRTHTIIRFRVQFITIIVHWFVQLFSVFRVAQCSMLLKCLVHLLLNHWAWHFVHGKGNTPTCYFLTSPVPRYLGWRIPCWSKATYARLTAIHLANRPPPYLPLSPNFVTRQGTAIHPVPGSQTAGQSLVMTSVAGHTYDGRLFHA